MFLVLTANTLLCLLMGTIWNKNDWVNFSIKFCFIGFALGNGIMAYHTYVNGN